MKLPVLVHTKTNSDLKCEITLTQSGVGMARLNVIHQRLILKADPAPMMNTETLMTIAELTSLAKDAIYQLIKLRDPVHTKTISDLK